MRHYEATVVLDPTPGEEGCAKHVDRIKESIEKLGGSILGDERWGIRDLAYSIKKQAQGYYAILEWEGEGSLIAELDRTLRLDESVLRHLILHIDPKQLAAREAQRKWRAAGSTGPHPDKAPGPDEKSGTAETEEAPEKEEVLKTGEGSDVEENAGAVADGETYETEKEVE